MNCEIEVLGDTDAFRFTGEIGDKVDILVLRYNNSADACFRVIEPDGTAGGFVCASGFREPSIGTNYVVRKQGTHTIQVSDGGGDEVFRYGLVISRVYPSATGAISIGAWGRVNSGEISPRGDNDFFSFNGASGDLVTIRLSRTAGSADICFRVIDPDGTIGAYRCASGFREPTVGVDVKLTKTGGFFLHIVDGGFDETYPYNLDMQCVGACPAPGNVIVPPATSPLRFLSVTPCRIADTRLTAGTFGGPSLNAATSRDFPIPQSGCAIPSTALAYSLNVTVVPKGPLSFLTIWPTGITRPEVSTLNAFDGRIKANAAIVPAGSLGSVSVFVTDASDVIVDINGYFVAANANDNLAFYPSTPCRISDTRLATGPFGGPVFGAAEARDIPILGSNCNIPSTARAYSLNMTAVPRGALGFLTTWPAGTSRPNVSTLNSPTGTVVANSAIVPAGTNGAISVFVTNSSDVVIDINGYFAPPGGAGALNFYRAGPCRVSDTRRPNGPFGGPVLNANDTRAYVVPSSACGIPTSAKAYSLNATVVPQGSLGFLTLFPAGTQMPVVSTLNSFDAAVVSNAAILPGATADGAINAFVTNKTDLILDINGYFAP